MDATLLLTTPEQKLFSALPENLREGWTVREESTDAFETDEQLHIRAGMAELHRWPALKPLMEQIVQGKELTADQVKDVPEEALPELLFTIGARGIAMLMVALLSQAKTDEDIQAIAAFGHLRHDILETNASISYA
ncbi:MAG: hypothetical protein G01um101425_347 [Candidatus Peregrinibacteria bacterium Gr01-1014_25]|nr:MAG: hypothetical protein G01um101425_347 [Candidatus Peregrinibacteria bacterium Gr01-1014_25]